MRNSEKNRGEERDGMATRGRRMVDLAAFALTLAVGCSGTALAGADPSDKAHSKIGRIRPSVLILAMTAIMAYPVHSQAGRSDPTDMPPIPGFSHTYPQPLKSEIPHTDPGTAAGPVKLDASVDSEGRVMIRDGTKEAVLTLDISSKKGWTNLPNDTPFNNQNTFVTQITTSYHKGDSFFTITSYEVKGSDVPHPVHIDVPVLPIGQLPPPYQNHIHF
jgi:hypothetical protein